MLRIEYRDHAFAPWRVSRMEWTAGDIAYLNAACGFEKYRVVKVEA